VSKVGVADVKVESAGVRCVVWIGVSQASLRGNHVEWAMTSEAVVYARTQRSDASNLQKVQ
jgi:hypothetical protein